MRWTGARRAAPSSTHSRIVADEWITSHLLCSDCGSEYDQDRDECDCGCPDADLIEQGSAGRFWGYRGLRRELAVRQVTPRIGIAAGRLARRWHRAKLSSPTSPPPAAAPAPSGSPAHLHTVEQATGRIVATRHTTTDLPDGVIYVPCGDRRASVCPPCAETYRADTYQLIRAGLVGGKGVPDHRRRPPGRVRHPHRTLLRTGPHPHRSTREPGRCGPAGSAATSPAARTGGTSSAPHATPRTTRGSAGRSAWTATTTPTRSSGTAGPANSGAAP